MRGFAPFQGKLCLTLIGLLAWGATRAEAGWPYRNRQRGVVPTTVTATARHTPTPVSSAPLGTFYPTPVMTVRGNFPLGGGYSPADSFGDTSLDIYGPLSSLRATAAPVLTYSRGYDGRGVITEGDIVFNAEPSQPFPRDLSDAGNRHQWAASAQDAAVVAQGDQLDRPELIRSSRPDSAYSFRPSGIIRPEVHPTHAHTI